MKFDFYTLNAAANNTDAARLREATRMCAIAHGLHRLGHDVAIVDAPRQLTESPRWGFFRHLHRERLKGVRVHSAETLLGDVGIKTSVGTGNDSAMLGRFELLVAHEYDEQFERHRKLLKVPFLVHDRVLSGFLEMGLFKAWLDNEVQRIREAFQWEPKRLLGYCGAGWPQRREKLKGTPDWADIKTYENHPMSGVEHARWLCGFRGGLCLSGDTPKTNLPPLLALLGVPIVMWPISRFDTPPISDFNAILFESWDQVRSELEDEYRVSGVREYATTHYVDSWSPAGQSRLIAEFFE